jgi:hypothetical protein
MVYMMNGPKRIISRINKLLPEYSQIKFFSFSDFNFLKRRLCFDFNFGIFKIWLGVRVVVSSLESRLKKLESE